MKEKSQRSPFIEHIFKAASSCSAQISGGECSVSIFCPWTQQFEKVLECFEVENEPDYLRFCLSRELNHCYVIHRTQAVIRVDYPMKQCGKQS